jgi:hypothetical protein
VNKSSSRSSAARMISFTVERAPGPDPTMESGISNGLVASYNFAISDSSTQYAFDPSGAGSYTLTARSGLPDISSIESPADSADEYSVSFSQRYDLVIPAAGETSSNIDAAGGGAFAASVTFRR